MYSRYQFLTLGIPWTQSMPSRDVNAATRLAEASLSVTLRLIHLS